MIIGLNTIGNFINNNNLPTSTTNNFYSVKLKKTIIDELYIAQNGDIDFTSKIDWAINTYLKAEFQNNIEAGNVGMGGLEINGWRIKRRRLDSVNIIELDTIPSNPEGDFYFTDTTPRSSIVYEYTVSPMSGDIEGEAHLIQIKIEFDYWWLTDGAESYPFFLNLDIPDINTNTQRNEYLGFNQYPIISYGNAKYKSGTITALLIDSFLQYSYDYREKVESFINNQKPKYMKSPYGDIWYIDTHTSRRKQMIELQDDVSYITFDFTEVANVED